MPHTTRQNYKSKLLQKEVSIVQSSLQQGDLNDRFYRVLEKEERDKALLHRLIAEVANVSVDVVRTMDKTSEVGSLKFAKCEELNDDKLTMCDAFSILNRTFDVLLTAEERIEELSVALSDATSAAKALASRTNIMMEKVAAASMLQHELYNIGKAPTEQEIEEFDRAETEGKVYLRSFADRSLQTHLPLHMESFDESSDTEPETTKPKQHEVAKKKTTPPKKK